MELSTKKVNNILKILNSGTIKGDWMPADGFHVIPAAEVQANGQFNSQLETGAPVKIFFNRVTGEMKYYVAALLV